MKDNARSYVARLAFHGILAPIRLMLTSIP